MNLFEKFFGEVAEKPKEELKRPPAQELPPFAPYSPTKENKKEEKPEKKTHPLSTPEEKKLEVGEKTGSFELQGTVNKVFFVKFEDGAEGIFKPKNGEAFTGTSVEKGTYFKRERAAYLVDRFIGFGLIPPTVIREIEGQIGSVQEFVPDAKTAAETLEHEKQAVASEMFKVWILDYLLYNTDRHGYNWLIRNQKIHAIDNGMSFGVRPGSEDEPFDHYFAHFNAPFPQEMKDMFEKFLSWEQGKEILRDLLLELLNKKETDAFFRRVEIVNEFLAQGKIPYAARNGLTFGS